MLRATMKVNPAPPEPARIIDLMEALKASLGKSKGAAPATSSSAAAPAEPLDRKPARRSEEKAEPKKKAAKR